MVTKIPYFKKKSTFFGNPWAYPELPRYLVCNAPNAFTLERVDILPWWEFLERELNALL